MYHLFLRRLRAIFPENLLLQVYQSYIQPKLSYSIWLYNPRKSYSYATFAKPCSSAYTGQHLLHQRPWCRVIEITKSIYHGRKEKLLPSHINVWFHTWISVFMQPNSNEILRLWCNGYWWNEWLLHDDVIKWKHFPRYWSFVRGIHRSPVNCPHKGQWRRALMFSLICAWINGCKQSWDWWFETSSWSLWLHYSATKIKERHIQE